MTMQAEVGERPSSSAGARSNHRSVTSPRTGDWCLSGMVVRHRLRGRERAAASPSHAPSCTPLS